MSHNIASQATTDSFDAKHLEVLYKSKLRLVPSTSDEWTMISVIAYREQTVHTHSDGGFEHKKITTTRHLKGAKLDDDIYLVERGAIVRTRPKSDWFGVKKDQPTGDYIEAEKLTSNQRANAIKVIEKLNTSYVRSEEARRARLLS